VPAYEVMNSLVKLGIPCAVGQKYMGELFITCLKSNKHYSGFALNTIEQCIRRELKVPIGITIDDFLAAA